MLLKNNFYTVLAQEKTENGLNCRLKLNSNHSIFEGHFPSSPVTPGVVEMEMVKEMVGDFLGRSAQLKKMSSCKLLAILNPTEHPEISIVIECSTTEDGFLKVNAQLHSTELVFMKMTAFYL